MKGLLFFGGVEDSQQWDSIHLHVPSFSMLLGNSKLLV